MFARACSVTLKVLAAGVVLVAANPLGAVTCPTAGEELPSGIYVASTSGELWRVSPRDGQGVANATLIGQMGDSKLGVYPTDIAFNDDGSLYAIDGFELYCMDPRTAITQTIGKDEFEPPWQTALAGRTESLGQLYGAGEDRLFEIQVQSGKTDATALQYGPLSCGTETGDIVFDAQRDVLYGTIDCYGEGFGDRSHLVLIHSQTGAILRNLGPIRDTEGGFRYGVFGLAFGPDGALYAGSESLLMKIDPLTAQSSEDYVIVSRTPGKSFDRVDGMTSRVCEAADQQDSLRHARTAGQWRQVCRDGGGNIGDLQQEIDGMVSYASNGLVTDTCDALHHGDPREAMVAAAAPGAGLVGAQDASPVGARNLRADAGGRRGTTATATGTLGDLEVILPAGQSDSGLETLCGLGLREYTAAALNILSGRINAACPACDLGPAGSALDQLGEQLRQAVIEGDKQTCNLVKRQAHHLAGQPCGSEDSGPGNNGNRNGG